MGKLPEVGSKVIFNKNLRQKDALDYWPHISEGDHIVVIADHVSFNKNVALFYQDVWNGPDTNKHMGFIITGTALANMFKPLEE